MWQMGVSNQSIGFECVSQRVLIAHMCFCLIYSAFAHAVVFSRVACIYLACASFALMQLGHTQRATLIMFTSAACFCPAAMQCSISCTGEALCCVAYDVFSLFQFCLLTTAAMLQHQLGAPVFVCHVCACCAGATHQCTYIQTPCTAPAFGCLMCKLSGACCTNLC
jgi:hypothetical protein